MENKAEIDKAWEIGTRRAGKVADTVLKRVRSKVGY